MNDAIQNPSPDSTAINTPDAPPVPKKPAPKRELPDWKPLGTVRDYFYEQMNQDQRYR